MTHIDPTRSRILFLDDSAIKNMSSVRRTLHQPVKRGPMLKPDTSIGQSTLQSRSAPVWNPDRSIWEWWYWAGYTVPPYGQYQSTTFQTVSYATSEDGIHWETPSLGLYEWNGSKDNNIAVSPDEGNRGLYHILRDERDPDPARRYKALMGTHDRVPAYSPDGFTWSYPDVPPIPSSDESHMTYDEQTGKFLAFVKHGTDWGRSVFVSESTDFVHWTRPELVMHSDETDRENLRKRIREVIENPAYLTPPLVDDEDYIAEVYQMAVMPYEGIYVGFPGLFNPAGAIPPPHMNFTGINQVELTVSHDYRHWNRVADREVFIGIDPWDGVNYGTAQNLLCGRPVVHDDREIRIYYNAIRFRGPKEVHRDIDPNLFDDTSALCMATLRRDGFVSLDADDEGEIVTKPIRAAALDGAELHINADAAGGFVAAEIIDAESGKPVAEYTREQCNNVEEDTLDGVISWKNGSRITVNKQVRLRFVLRNAQLYSFWIT